MVSVRNYKLLCLSTHEVTSLITLHFQYSLSRAILSLSPHHLQQISREKLGLQLERVANELLPWLTSMSSASRSACINRLADPLRGKHSNFDELTSDDESGINSHNPIKSPKKTLRSSIGYQIQKREPMNLLPSNGFFLTESASNYSEDSFEEYEVVTDVYESINHRSIIEREEVGTYKGLSATSPKRSISKQREDRELSHKYDREIKESMTQSICNLLHPISFSASDVDNQTDIFADDDVLSRVRQRLEDATALESLIKKNKLRDGESRRGKEKSAALTKGDRLLSRFTSKAMSKQNTAAIPTVRKKGWEDITHETSSTSTVRRRKDVRESISMHKNADSEHSKSLPVPVPKIKPISVRIERIRKNIREISSQSNDDVEFNLKRRLNKTTTGMKSSTIYRGKIRNSNVRINQVKNTSTSATRFPAIDIKKKSSNMTQNKPRVRNVKIEPKSTFMTDITSLTFSSDEHERSIVENRKMKKNKVSELNEKIRADLSKKRMESKSAPNPSNLNNLERIVRAYRKVENNVINIRKERTTRSDTKHQEMATKNNFIAQILKKKTGNNTRRNYANFSSETKISDMPSDEKLQSASEINGIMEIDNIDQENVPPTSEVFDLSDSKRKKSISLAPKLTGEIIEFLTQVEAKEINRIKTMKDNPPGDLWGVKCENPGVRAGASVGIDGGDNSAALLVKHAKRLGSHWAAAELYAAQYSCLADDEE